MGRREGRGRETGKKGGEEEGDREGGRGGGGERERATASVMSGLASQTRERKDDEGTCIWMQSVTGWVAVYPCSSVYPEKLLALCKEEIAKSKDVKKLLASVNVYVCMCCHHLSGKGLN